MNNPLKQISSWLDEERNNGNIFPQGAVLSTISKNGNPRSRVVGTMLDEDNVPKFFTSPSSRKIEDIGISKKVALTYSFQHPLRSISIEGSLEKLSLGVINNDWLKQDENFRMHYVVFGHKSGTVIDNLNELRKIRNTLKPEDYGTRPDSFVGYKFSIIDRISFYSVKDSDFALNDVYNYDSVENKWSHKLLIP